MAISVDLPGGRVELEHVLFDVNGTLAVRGHLVDGVDAAMRALRQRVDVLLLSSDTYGTLGEISTTLGVPHRSVRDGADKAAIVAELGASVCAAIGNGANDELMLRDAAIGIVVIGAEGAAPQSLLAADVVCVSVHDAIGLLLDPVRLTATLRP